MRPYRAPAACCVVLMLAAAGVFVLRAAAQPAPRDGIAALLRQLERTAAAADAQGILALGAPAISRPSFQEFARSLTTPAPTRVVVNERDRAALEQGAQRLIIEVFSEHGIEGRLGTWRVDVQPGPLHRIPGRLPPSPGCRSSPAFTDSSLNATKQYDIHNLTVHAPDLVIEMPSGRAFVAETADGPTALVLLGHGRMRFTPPDPAERTQVRIFGGAKTLESTSTRRSSGSIPVTSRRASTPGRSVRVAVEPGGPARGVSDLQCAHRRTLQIDLSDLSRDRWSLLPSSGDVIGELHTKKFGTLTYTRSGSDAGRHHALRSQAAAQHLRLRLSRKAGERGRFYSEDEQPDYDVLHVRHRRASSLPNAAPSKATPGSRCRMLAETRAR